MSFWKRPSNVIMVISAALLLVGTVILLVLAIPEGGPLHRNEAGFQEGVPKWVQGDFPLMIKTDAYTAEGLRPILDDYDTADVIESVVDVINTRLGFTAFTIARSQQEIDVSLVIGVPAEEDWLEPGGHSNILHTGGRATRCNVLTSNTGTLELLYLVIYHELGHCLGLAHDDFELSIMRPVQRATPDGMLQPWITDHDRKIIRERYTQQ